MHNIFYVADHDTTTHVGGAEKVDENIYKALDIKLIKSEELNKIGISDKATYVLGNATFLSKKIKEDLIANRNYLIFEHDYKIHPTRQPHRYQNNIFPENELINLDFYNSARVVFLQTQDHLDCFLENKVKANLISLGTSIWDKKELDFLHALCGENKESYKCCILGNTSLDKGSDLAISFCNQNNLDYIIIPNLPLIDFYKELSKYATLVYIPRVKESFCRLVVEARMLRMNVLTTKTYGATKEPWFHLSGVELVSFLREKTLQNLQTISKYL